MYVTARMAVLALVAVLTGCAAQAEDAPEATPPAPAEEPRLVIAPHSGPPGTSVELTATGFPPNSEVLIGIGPPQSEYSEIRRERTDAEGSLNTTATLPEWVRSGEPYVWAVADPSSRPRALSEPFLVTEQSTEGDMPEGSVLVEGVVSEEGVECPALRSDGGDLYTLAGAPGDLEPGQRVRVVGTIAEISTCMQGTTIQVQRVDRQ